MLVVFRLFGPYEGIPNLLFTDFAERLGDTGNVDYMTALGRDFVRMMEQTTCGSATIGVAKVTLVALVGSLLSIWMY